MVSSVARRRNKIVGGSYQQRKIHSSGIATFLWNSCPKLQRIAKHEREGVPNRLKAGRPPVFSENAQAKLESACAASTVQLSEEEHE